MFEPIDLSYDLRLLPRGRIAFHRWRYELWSGPLLLAAGWRLTPQHAQRALRAHAVRHAHRVHGLYALHPDAAPATEPWWAGRAVEVKSGDLRVTLTPRGLVDARA